MATLTTANGGVTIYAQNKELLDAFVSLQQLRDRSSTYETVLEDYDNFEDEVFGHPVFAHYRYLPVYGDGRHTFQSNIEWFFDAVFNHEYKKPSDNKLRDRLKHYTFLAEFEIIEDDFTYQVINKINQNEQWDPKTKTQETTYQHIVSHPLTALNMADYRGSEPWEYVDVEYMLDNWENTLEHLQNVISRLDNPETSQHIRYLEEVEYPKESTTLYRYIINHQDVVKSELERMTQINDIASTVYTLFLETDTLKPFIEKSKQYL